MEGSVGVGERGSGEAGVLEEGGVGLGGGWCGSKEEGYGTCLWEGRALSAGGDGLREGGGGPQSGKHFRGESPNATVW